MIAVNKSRAYELKLFTPFHGILVRLVVISFKYHRIPYKELLNSRRRHIWLIICSKIHLFIFIFIY